MRKLLFVMMIAMLPVAVNAKGKYSLIVDGKGTNVYEDSIVKVDASVWDNLEVLQLVVYNKTSARMYIEWEGVKISGSHIAFLSDRVFELNRERQPELITAESVCVKMICKRYANRVPIADGAGDYFYLVLPLKVGNDYHDLDIKYIVKKAED